MEIPSTTSVGVVPTAGRINQPTSSIKKQEQEKRANSTKLATGVGLAAAFGLGVALKDGVKNGFNRVGDFSNAISNVISVPFSLLFPYFMLSNERQTLQGNTSKDDLLNRMVYTAASLGFAPNTWGEPLKMGARSTPHLIATILNLPHTVFSFLTYTGGRALSALTAFKKSKDPTNFRLEQEFESLYKLGNLGSAQASVIPMAGQFVLGWETILDVVKGNFGSAKERFKHEPISVILGTLFNSWAWPFEYVAKFLDTTIRTAEGVESFQNAFNTDGKDSWLISRLKELKGWWHKNSQTDTALGKFLKNGRHFSKIEALLLPPIGMVSVIAPVLNRFLRGEFWNKEAQEIGGVVGLFDKVFNVGAFFSHLYYVGTYALSVRLPQTITTGIFYGSHFVNKLRGKCSGQSGYVEPNSIRDKIFNRDSGFIKTISNWAAVRLDCIELQLHPDKLRLINDLTINKNTKQVWIAGKEVTGRFDERAGVVDIMIRCLEERKDKIEEHDSSGNEIIKLKGTNQSSHIRGFHKVMADEVIYTPLREKYYSQMARENGNVKPSDAEWGNALNNKYKKLILSEVEITFKQYLKESVLLDGEQINSLISGKYRHEYEGIKKQVEDLIDEELKHLRIIQEENLPVQKLPDITSKSFLELLTNWKDLVKVIKLKTFHATNSILPLWIKGFVNVVDYGKKGEEFWLRNLKATETGIREGDVKQACDREFMPVVGFAFQSMGKGLAAIYELLHGRLPKIAAE